MGDSGFPRSAQSCFRCGWPSARRQPSATGRPLPCSAVPARLLTRTVRALRGARPQPRRPWRQGTRRDTRCRSAGTRNHPRHVKAVLRREPHPMNRQHVSRPGWPRKPARTPSLREPCQWARKDHLESRKHYLIAGDHSLAHRARQAVADHLSTRPSPAGRGHLKRPRGDGCHRPPVRGRPIEPRHERGPRGARQTCYAPGTISLPREKIGSISLP